MTYPRLMDRTSRPCVKCGTWGFHLAWTNKKCGTEGFYHVGIKVSVEVPKDVPAGGLIVVMCSECGHGIWCLPRDYVDPTPSFEEAARREVEGICTALKT